MCDILINLLSRNFEIVRIESKLLVREYLQGRKAPVPESLFIPKSLKNGSVTSYSIHSSFLFISYQCVSLKTLSLVFNLVAIFLTWQCHRKTPGLKSWNATDPKVHDEIVIFWNEFWIHIPKLLSIWNYSFDNHVWPSKKRPVLEPLKGKESMRIEK